MTNSKENGMNEMKNKKNNRREEKQKITTNVEQKDDFICPLI